MAENDGVPKRKLRCGATIRNASRSNHEVLGEKDLNSKNSNPAPQAIAPNEGGPVMARTAASVKKVTCRGQRKAPTKVKTKMAASGKASKAKPKTPVSTKTKKGKGGGKSSAKSKVDTAEQQQPGETSNEGPELLGDDGELLVQSGFVTPGRKRKAPPAEQEDGELDLDLNVSQEELNELDSDMQVSPEDEETEAIDDAVLIDEAKKLREQVANKQRAVDILEQLKTTKSAHRQKEVAELKKQLAGVESRLADLRQQQSHLEAQEKVLAVTPSAPATTNPPSPRSVVSQRSWLPAAEREVVALADSHLDRVMTADPAKRTCGAPYADRPELEKNPPKRRKVVIEEASTSSDEPLGRSSSSSSSSDLDSDSDKERRKRRQKRKLKSGRFAKHSTKVKKTQSWPHNHLDPQFVHHIPKFADLTWDQLVAGELSVIADTKSDRQRMGRIKLLRQLAYWKVRTADFSRVKKLYAAIVSRIEQGKAKWDSDFELMEIMVMGDTGNGGQKSSFGGNKPNKSDSKNTYFCKKFQTGECSQSLKNNGHTGQLGSRTVFMVHICAACWLKDKKQERHPEKSDTCPHHRE